MQEVHSHTSTSTKDIVETCNEHSKQTNNVNVVRAMVMKSAPILAMALVDFWTAARDSRAPPLATPQAFARAHRCTARGHSAAAALFLDSFEPERIWRTHSHRGKRSQVTIVARKAVWIRTDRQVDMTGAEKVATRPKADGESNDISRKDHSHGALHLGNGAGIW